MPGNSQIVITCGPAHEPIDQVRRITNFSTGRLGVYISNRFARQGWMVTCFKGEGATCPDKLSEAIRQIWFSTNESLSEKMRSEVVGEEVAFCFHAAALCDYRVRQVVDGTGTPLNQPKLSSRAGELTIHLEPAAKILPHIKEWFPNACLVGWKYELNGNRADAISKGRAQIEESNSDACVVNGAAYGAGFGFLEKSGKIQHLETMGELGEFLTGYVTQVSALRKK
ncbi:MAG: phosphopantothenoylcysteine decarboxylase [Verrucomicrobiota bacterium]|nr:phosphopantothenoylcysteine decarboxylase [Verrucomicrobiota bacterium]